jgi:class 3 adenylate cyclase
MKFRDRILLGTLIPALLVLLLTLGVTQTTVLKSFDRLFTERFHRQMEAAEERDSLRFSQYRAKITGISESVRLLAALEDGEVGHLYEIAQHEVTLRGIAPESMLFIRFADKSGSLISPPKPHLYDEALVSHQPTLKAFFAEEESVEAIGLIPGVGLSTARNEAVLVIVHRVFDKITKEVKGGLIIGFPYTLAPRDVFVFSDQIFGVPLAEQEKRDLIAFLLAHPKKGEAGHVLTTRDEESMLFWREVPALSLFGKVYRGAHYSLEGRAAEKAALLKKICIIGVGVLFFALVLARKISKDLSIPIEKLVEGTVAVGKGDYHIEIPVKHQDEIGRLAHSFNEMSKELALKERYRMLLEVVSDKTIANALIREPARLGGEVRKVSILFCDIRGFTALTDGMAPQEVIEMLNEHMTALTDVVYRHGGVVDKFVGDLIMAIFGAPSSTGDDATACVKCALDMISEREALNQLSKFSIQMGIGIASGEAVAGCMGSRNRMNYTVLGDKVNLAARLCSAAGAGQVVIDRETLSNLTETILFEERERQKFKGFAEEIVTYRVYRPAGQAVISEVA